VTVHRVAVLGTGLIGGSVGLSLTSRGVDVHGFDRDVARVERAKELGAITLSFESVADAVAGVDLVIVAVPVGAIAGVAQEALDAGAPLVTDVGSVKGPVVAAVESAATAHAARFIGGHPMAGSEQEGVDGARADLFVGATWVLTPTPATDERAYTSLRAFVRSLGAEVVTITPEHHDVLVALVSHVPQLAASTLMQVATDHEEEHRTLLRLAAGGFRDMTRIAAGHTAIWPDILGANRDAVLDALDAYLGALQSARDLVAGGDRAGLLALLEDARSARRNLPVGATVAADLVELRVPVPDRPGVLAEVTTLAGRLGVNVADVEIAHSLEGGAGVVVLVVAADGADALEAGLHDLGYSTSRTAVP
jgi:prephenate dehydrogenase